MKTDATPAVSPNDWHKRPKQNKKGPCPVCGYSGRTGEHRRVEDPDALYPRYVRRWKTAHGWQEETVDTRSKRKPPTIPRPLKPPRKPPGPSDSVKQGMVRVLRAHVFGGKTIQQIAQEMEITQQAISEWRRRYRTVWDAIETDFTNQVIEWTRSVVGTDAVLQDVDLYLHRATLADKWCAAAGVPLFTEAEDPTLSSFFEKYYLPTCLSDAAPTTVALYRLVIRRWRLLTGDPSLKAIDTLTLAKFRDACAKARGMKPWQRAAPTSVAGKLRCIQTLLDKAGPDGRRNRDAAGILEKVPWVRGPRMEARPVRIVDTSAIDAVYTAAVGMERPRIEHLKPAAWWRALLVVVWSTGLRRRTLLELRWDMVDWERRFFQIPGTSMKARRFQIQPFPEVVARHLRAIRRSEDGLIFPWPHHLREFTVKWHQLLDLAGIPRGEHFGLHDIRKTLATKLWQDSPEAAQFALGHSSAAVTARHYVGQTGIVARAVDAIPQPAAFTSVPIAIPEELSA